MPSSGVTRANENRRLRQEALRDQLAAQGHEQHINEIIKKFKDPEEKIDADMFARLKEAGNKHLALLSKYLPDLKQTDSNINMDARVTDATDDEIDARLAHYFAKATEGGGS